MENVSCLFNVLDELCAQVEGAFTQGVGLFTMEQCVHLEGSGRTQRGQLHTTGPGTYKIPACSDIPVQLNVTLLDGTSNPRAIFSSKVNYKAVLEVTYRYPYVRCFLRQNAKYSIYIYCQHCW